MRTMIGQIQIFFKRVGSAVFLEFAQLLSPVTFLGLVIDHPVRLAPLI